MEEPNDLVPPARLRVMQIIVFAQVMGVLVFAAVAIYLVVDQGNGRGMAPPADLPVFSLVGVVGLGVLTVASFAFTNFQLRQGLRRIARGQWRPPPGAESAFPTDASKLLALRHTNLISALALIEGGAFLCCIAYLLEGRPYMLALIFLAVVLQVARFPTETGLRAWMGRQLDWLEQERQRSGPAERG
jgi:hypothetical protein